jgi:hypothetical protein
MRDPQAGDIPRRNRFEIGVMLAIIGLTLTILGIAVQGGQMVGDFGARIQSLERHVADARTEDITPGAAREVASLRARQDADDRHWQEWDKRLIRIEETQRAISENQARTQAMLTQVLVELRRR